MKKLLVALLCVSTYSYSDAFYEVHCRVSAPALCIPNAIDAIKKAGPISWFHLDPSHKLQVGQGTKDMTFISSAISIIYSPLVGAIAAETQKSRAQYYNDFYKTHLYPHQVGLIATALTIATPAIINAIIYCKQQMPNYAFPIGSHALLNLILTHQQPDALKNALLIRYATYDSPLYKAREELTTLARTLMQYQDRYQATRKACYNDLIAIIEANICLVNQTILLLKENRIS